MGPSAAATATPSKRPERDSRDRIGVAAVGAGWKRGAREPAGPIEVLDRRDLGDGRAACRDRLAQARQDRAHRVGESLAVLGRLHAVGPRQEVAEARGLAAAGDMEPGAQTVGERRRLDRQISEEAGGQLADPFHRLQEEIALGPERGLEVEVRPVAAGAPLGVRSRAAQRGAGQDRRDAPLPELLPDLQDLRLDVLARQSAGDKADPVGRLRDALPRGRQVGDRDAAQSTI